VTFRFKAVGDATGFECAIVRQPRQNRKAASPRYEPCRSPKTFAKLKAGSFVFYLRAVGPGGEAKNPVTYRLKIA
jgi:hypothetical protein